MNIGTQFSSARDLLNYLNNEYVERHKQYENLFWKVYMGESSLGTSKDEALNYLDEFRTHSGLKLKVDEYIDKVSDQDEKERLIQWQTFFSLYQIPKTLVSIKEKINRLDTKMQKRMASRVEYYKDPYTHKKVFMSHREMKSIIATHSDEKIRKACWDAIEEQSLDNLDDYVTFVGFLNKFAQKQGYKNYMDYNIHLVEGMTTQQVMTLFGDVFKKTKYALTSLKEKAKEPGMKGLNKPWNKAYLLTGDVTLEEDQYFPFEKALERWGRSFQELGISFGGSALTLDLLSRKGKYDNGFCHWPEVVYKDKKGNLKKGKAQFTCNVIYEKPGSSYEGYNTLFHEGGHAAHLLNSHEGEACVNTEYPPASTAWAETQSQFLDTMLSSYEWKSKYALNEHGEAYPFELFKRKVERLHTLSPLALNGIIMVTQFEYDVYTCENLTKEKVITFAKKAWRKYQGSSIDSIKVLTVPHIYSFNSSCYYQGYGLAELALVQWREYFYKKYGCIVDNKKVGEELMDAWSTGSRYSFASQIKRVTGKELSADAWIKNATLSKQGIINLAKKRARLVAHKPLSSSIIDLSARITLTHGNRTIATNKKSFEDMASRYASWLKSKKF